MFSSQDFIGPVASLKFDPQFAKKSATQTKSTRGKGCRIPKPIQIRSTEPRQVSRVKIVMRFFSPLSDDTWRRVKRSRDPLNSLNHTTDAPRDPNSPLLSIQFLPRLTLKSQPTTDQPNHWFLFFLHVASFTHSKIVIRHSYN